MRLIRYPTEPQRLRAAAGQRAACLIGEPWGLVCNAWSIDAGGRPCGRASRRGWLVRIRLRDEAQVPYCAIQ